MKEKYHLIFLCGSIIVILSSLFYLLSGWYLNHQIEIIDIKIEGMETNRLTSVNYINRADNLIDALFVLEAVNESENVEFIYNKIIEFDVKAIEQLFFSAYQRNPDKSVIESWKSNSMEKLQDLYSYYFKKFTERHNNLIEERQSFKFWLDLSYLVYPIMSAIGLFLILASDYYVRKKQLEKK